MGQVVTAARDLVRQGQQTRRRGLAKIQIAVGVVFNHQHLMLGGQLQHAAAPRQAEHGPAWITEGRDQVDHARLVLDDELLEPIDLHALRIDGCADELRAVEPKALNGGQKSRALHDHLIARVDHHLGQQVQRLLAAGGHDQAFGTGGGALGRHEAGQFLAQGTVAFGGTVLQGRARFMAEGLLRGLAQTLDVKHRTVRKASGKADDAGLAQQFEQFTDGGGFDVLESVGKLDRHGRGSTTGNAMVAPVKAPMALRSEPDRAARRAEPGPRSPPPRQVPRH